MLETHDANVVISPYSVAMALGLTSQGTRGETLYEIAGTMHLMKQREFIARYFRCRLNSLKKSSGSASLRLANKIYLADGNSINPSCYETAVSDFKSGIETLKFGEPLKAAQTINRWIETKTNHKVNNFIRPESIDAKATAILVNAISLNGNWLNPFEENQKALFHTGEGTIEMSFMTQWNQFRICHLNEFNARVLEMKIENSELAVWIILPNEQNGLAYFESKLLLLNLTAIESCFVKKSAYVMMPKFEIDSETDLKPVLKEVKILLSGFCDDVLRDFCLSRWEFTKHSKKQQTLVG